MSILRNLLGNFMPHFESRRNSGVLAANNAELVVDVNGDDSALIFINGTATFNATYNIQGSADGVNFCDLLAYPYSPGSVGGTLPQPGQPLVTEAVNSAVVQRLLCAGVGGLQKIRVRLTAYTSGTATVSINTDSCQSLSPYLRDQKAATLMVTSTGAAAAAVTATLPAVAGLRHYIYSVKVVRFATATLTAAATPVLVTTTNIPGSPVLSFPAEAAVQGSVYQDSLDYGGAGMASSAVNIATTIVCPATTGAIWRVNVAYRLGL
jgi:hypothetical protein